MALDPSIPLSYQPPQVTSPLSVAQGMMTLQDAMQTRELKQLQLQDYMETKQKYQKVQQAAQNKSYYDPQKGGWTPEGLGAVMTIDPELGSKIQSAQERSTMMASQLQSQQLQQQQLRIKQQEVSSSVLDDARKQAASVWEQSEGMDPAKRAELYNSTWSKAIESKKSLLMSANIDEKDIQHEMQNPPDPRQAKAASMSPKDIMDQKRKDEEQKRKDESEKRLENKPESPEGKINSDYKKGFITREQRDAALANKSGGEELSEDALKAGAYAKLMLGKEFTGLGRASTEVKKKIANWSAHIGKELGLSPLEQAMLPINNKIKMKAVDKLTTWGAFVEKSTLQLDKTIDIAIDYAKQLGPGRLASINKAILAGKKEFNDPVANQYALQVNTIRAETARLYTAPTSNAMLPVEAMKKSDELISSGLNVAGWEAIKVAVLRDAGAARSALQDAKDNLLGSVMNMGKEGAVDKDSGAVTKPSKDSGKSVIEWSELK
jgi:hypothetical protein